MFTGIAEGIGTITSLEQDDDIVRITVNHSLDNNDISINDSICCSGICLTIVKQNKSSFQVEMVPETIERSTAKLNTSFFDKIFGAGKIKTKKEFENEIHKSTKLSFCRYQDLQIAWIDPSR